MPLSRAVVTSAHGMLRFDRRRGVSDRAAVIQGLTFDRLIILDVFRVFRGFCDHFYFSGVNINFSNDNGFLIK